MRFAPDGKLMDTPPRVAIAEPQTGHDWLNRNWCMLFGSVRPEHCPKPGRGSRRYGFSPGL